MPHMDTSAGVQHQIANARRLQAERVGYRRAEVHQALLVRAAWQSSGGTRHATHMPG
jgi:hypothetical protein